MGKNISEQIITAAQSGVPTLESGIEILKTGRKYGEQFGGWLSKAIDRIIISLTENTNSK